MKHYSNFYLTLYTSILLSILVAVCMQFNLLGLVLGILYAQIIEWFVHGWIQHHPFKIFKQYRDMHMYHHKHPTKPLAVQPIVYFILGSILLLAPFYYVNGFYLGYFIMYTLINVVHYDLHSAHKLLPNWIWDTYYFRWIKSHHEAHHAGRKVGYSTHSVTNPFLDVVFSHIKLVRMNNWIAKHLKL